ncbi:hypothetical protein [Accumulibacter sp.]|uniref:type IV pilus assembly protein FimV n=1 Tax=Accumulibacter sp. TaxID=2053492 RepID=UPI002605AE9F|nr:hypothetical protein [Accumulibacter sp.]
MPCFSAENSLFAGLLGRIRDASLMAKRVDRRLLGVLLSLLLLATPDVGTTATVGQPGKARGSALTSTDKQASDPEIQLRLSEHLSMTGEASDRRRDLLRLEQRTLQIVEDRHHDSQALSDKIGWLEADSAELKRIGERLGATAAALPAAPPDRPAAPSGAVGAASPPALPPANTTLPDSPPMKAVAKQTALAPVFNPDEWVTYAGLAAVALLVTLLVFRRHRGPRQDAPVEMTEKPAVAAVDARLSPTREEEATVPIAVPARPPEPLPARSPLPAAQEIRGATPAPADPDVTSRQTEAATALDLAEIMLSFGRVSGAAKTLQEYIAANPKEALRPWIRLLQIYQDNGMRDEFTALAQTLNRNFNVEVLRWQDDEAARNPEALPSGQQQRAVTLEEIPHLRERIISLWGKAGCLDYLEQLLRDNRGGQRNGFSLPVVEELLFLIDLVAAREAVHQPHP